MDKQEQGNRHQSSRNARTRAAQSRRGARGSEADAATRTVVEEFRAAARLWASTLGVKPNKLFTLMPDHDRSVHWMRERYFGGVVPKSEDTEWVRLKAMGTTGITGGASQELRIYRYAIEEMCRVCTGGGTSDELALCPDAICPLRSVSPLELKPSAWKRLPLSADEAQ